MSHTLVINAVASIGSGTFGSAENGVILSAFEAMAYRYTKQYNLDHSLRFKGSDFAAEITEGHCALQLLFFKGLYNL